MRLVCIWPLVLGGTFSTEVVDISCGDGVRNRSFVPENMAEFKFVCEIIALEWFDVRVTMGVEIPASQLRTGSLPWRGGWSQLVIEEEDLGMEDGNKFEIFIKVPKIANEEYKSSMLVEVLSDFNWKLNHELKMVVEEEARTSINDVQLIYILNNMRLDFLGPNYDSRYWANLGTRLKKENTSMVVAHGNNFPWYYEEYASQASSKLRNILSLFRFVVMGVGEYDMTLHDLESIRKIAVNKNLKIVASNLVEAPRDGSALARPFDFVSKVALPACPGQSVAIFSVVSQLTASTVMNSMPSGLLFTSESTWLPEMRAECDSAKKENEVVGCILLYHGGPEAMTWQDIDMNNQLALDTELTRVLIGLDNSFMAVFAGANSAEYLWTLPDLTVHLAPFADDAANESKEELEPQTAATADEPPPNSPRRTLVKAEGPSVKAKGTSVKAASAGAGGGVRSATSREALIGQALPGSSRGLVFKIPCDLSVQPRVDGFSVPDIESDWTGGNFDEVGEVVWDPRDTEPVMPIEEDYLLARNVQELPTFMEENPLANAIAESLLQFSEEQGEADIGLIDVGAIQVDATVAKTNGTGFLDRSFFRHGLTTNSRVCVIRVDGASLKVLLESQWGNGEYRIAFALANLTYLRQEMSSRHRRIFDETILVNDRSWHAGRIYGIATIDRLCRLLPPRRTWDLALHSTTLMDLLADGRAIDKPLHGDRRIHAANAGIISNIQCSVLTWTANDTFLLSLRSPRRIHDLQIHQLLDDEDPKSNLLATLRNVNPHQFYTISLTIQSIDFNSVVLWMNTAQWKDQRFHRSLVTLQVPQFASASHASSLFLLSPFYLLLSFLFSS